MKGAKYDVGDNPDAPAPAKMFNSQEDSGNHFSDIASRAWQKINRWQKKAETAAFWLDSLATGKKAEVEERESLSKDTFGLSSTHDDDGGIVSKRFDEGVLRNLSIPVGPLYSNRSTPCLSAKSQSQSSSASSSQAGTPKLSAKSLSSSGPSSPDPTITLGLTLSTNRQCVSPFPNTDDEKSSPHLSSSPSHLSCDGSRDFVMVSKALRQGWRWLVCRFMMRKKGSDSVKRLLMSCGVQVPTIQSKGGTEEMQVCQASSSMSSTIKVMGIHRENNFVDNPSKQLPVLTPSVSPLKLSMPDSNYDTCLRKCLDMLNRAKSQQKAIIEIVRNARSLAIKAGMAPPLAVKTETNGNNEGGPSILAAHQKGRVPPRSKSRTSPSVAADGPKDSATSKIQIQRYAWDNVADLFRPKTELSDSHAISSHLFLDQHQDKIDLSASPSDRLCSRLVTYAVSSVEGHTYEGEFSRGKMHGYGKLVWPDGHWYQGQFDNEHTCGIGMRGWPSGHWYIGEESAGLKAGLGAMAWPGGRRYEGRFNNDLRNGFGLMLWPSGKWYMGTWKDGLQHGEGVEGGDVTLAFVRNEMGSKHHNVKLEESHVIEQQVMELFGHDYRVQLSQQQADNDDIAPHDYAAPLHEETSGQDRSGWSRGWVLSESSLEVQSNQVRGLTTLMADKVQGAVDPSSEAKHAKSAHQEWKNTEEGGRTVVGYRVVTQGGDDDVTGLTESEGGDAGQADIAERGEKGDAEVGCGEWDDEELEGSIEVSSSLDETDSDETSPTQLLSSGRVRTSDRMLEMIQGGPVASMVDDDDEDEDEEEEEPNPGEQPSQQDPHVPAGRMLAERLAAHSSRCAAAPPQPSTKRPSPTSPSPDADADPQFPPPCAQAAAAVTEVMPLWTAAAAGDSAGVSRALRRGGAMLVNAQDPDDGGCTALIKAVRAGCGPAVNEVLRARADPCGRDRSGWTAMHMAGAGGHGHLLDTLIRAGAKVDERNGAGETALHCAARAGMVRVCAALVALGADPNAMAVDGSTPLHRCGEAGQLAAGRALVRLGAGTALRNAAGLTACEVAATCHEGDWAAAISCVARLAASHTSNVGVTGPDHSLG